MLAFVLVTLVTLVAVPILVDRHAAEPRETISEAEKARILVNRLRYNLLSQMWALSEFIITGDPQASRVYTAARTREATILQELSPSVERLGPTVRAQYTVVRARADEWHARAADEDVFEGRLEALSPLVVPRERVLFDQLVIAATNLDTSIRQSAAAAGDRIRRAERTGLTVTIFLGFLALVAGAAAALLAGRARRFAEESERRRSVAEAALEASDRANEARERLLRGVTHDVKNPLGAAKAYAELLSMEVKGPILPEQALLVAGVQRSVDSALSIITDLLDVARADSGGLSLVRVEVDLSAVAAEAVADHRLAAEAAGHELKLEGTTGPLPIYTDPARVRQVLDNLLSNALKYTPPPGRMSVRAEVREGEAGPRPGRWAAVRVIDTGPGIPRGERERVFEEFTRLDDGGETEGHGLGLAIARNLARMLGGELAVEETGEPGATFVLWLPLRERSVESPRG